ncbi:MAG: Eco57I restriction-modification methylase domain-containing protein [Microbacteriaceae bacterium]
MSQSFGEMLRRDRQNRAPDVLNTIANLSSDEVFTPPDFANKMLDRLAEAWAADHGGESIWADPTLTFLDPATKSGVFLREIAKRLVEGQGNPPEGSDDRKALLDQVLTKQVFGLGMTTLTSLLARRSIYCSKDATSKHSVAPSLKSPTGNIWFERTNHTWVHRKKERRIDPLSADEVVVDLLGTGKCKWCNATEAILNRGEAAETHAYAFIHTHDPRGLVAEIFGAPMQFDVIIGNPPYQINTDQADTKITGSIPLYHLFVEQAKKLNPRYLSMVIPARWMAGGRGLDGFRASMLADRRVRTLVDYPIATDVFGGVEIGGGVCYFLWDRAHNGQCSFTTVRGVVTTGPDSRDLGQYDVFIRDNVGLKIVEKVSAFGEPSVAGIASGQKPFGISTNFDNFLDEAQTGGVLLHYVRPGKRLTGYIPLSEVAERGHSAASTWKVFTPEASDGRGTVGHRPAVILGKPIIAGPGEVCSNTYLSVGPFDDQAAAESFVSYYKTKFFRFLVSLRKITQHASNFTYTWVPEQAWDRLWTDSVLYEKYQLTEQEIAYIESEIKTMDVGASSLIGGE